MEGKGGMFIGSDGPRTARMAIVGEKPGREECRLGKPFVGPSGYQLDGLLSSVGSHRSQVYITNAVTQVENFNNPTRDEIKRELPRLYKELCGLPNLNIIVPMGNAALQALSNFHLGNSSEVKGKEKGTGIKKYRGSLLPTFFRKKMLPTFHPAFYMRGEWRFKPIVKSDLSRALEESYDPNLNVPTRRCYIAESQSDISEIGRIFTKADHISFDIELLKGRFIRCIAFSKDPSEAYCIPLTTGRRKSIFSPSEETFAWVVIQQILNQEKTYYVTQNGLFDCWHLWRHGINTPYMSRGFDTMLAHRLRAPDLPHDLGFLVSLYTREPYYKNESGDWKDQENVDDNTFFAYNCKDAACTLEVAHELQKDLARNNMLEYFHSEIQAQWDVVTQMRRKGLRVDPKALEDAKLIIAADIEKDKQFITSKLGWLPNTKSYIDMGKVYDKLQIKPTAADLTPKGKPKTDIERLYNHAYNNPNHREVLYTIAGINAKRTLQSGFTNLPLDVDGFYHPSLDISKTKTGRCSSSGADEGGPQIQNVPKRIRSVFVPDKEEHELTNADLAGAEAMIVAWVSEDPLMIEAFLQKKKIHKVRGCVIYRNWNSPLLPPDNLLNSIRLVCDDCAKIGESECNHSEYYMSKQSGHAMAYREGPRRFCHEQRKKGIFINESIAKELRSKIITKHLHQWHVLVENSLRRSSWMESPLGRKRQFFGQLDDKLINQALSWFCQTTVGQITNRAMMYLYNKYREEELDARVWTQTHDSVTTTHHKSIRGRVRELYNEAFNSPMLIHGRELLIPIEITHGPNWRDLK